MLGYIAKRDTAASLALYNEVLPTLGVKRLVAYGGADDLPSQETATTA